MQQVFHINWSLFRVAAILFLFLMFSPQASAQAIPATELDGYAWSSTIGWVSLNCRTGGATANNICATSNYKVSINADRTITGYAWSSNIGWIKFGGLSGFPAGGGTTAANASVTGTYPNLTLTGWARACAGTNNPTASESKDCSSMTMNDNSGGWDGWISLRGTGYSVVTSSGGMNANSFAWGSTIVGWLDMSDALWINPSATLSVANCVITTAGASTCQAATTWNITSATTPNIYNVTTATQYTTALSGTNVPRTIRLGANVIVARDGSAVLATANPVATCGAGLVSSGGVCITDPATIAPVITIDAVREIARIGDTVTISWTITPEPLASGTCTLNGPGLSGSVTGSGNRTSAALSNKSRFSITCVGTYGTVSDSVEIEVIPTAQEV